MTGNPMPDKSSTAIKMLSDLVHENMEREDFDVEEFAALAGVSRSELYRRIKKLTGKSVTHFIRDIRLEESLKLLQHTDWTASEVGYKVGFNSPTYFSKCFKDKFGITPGEADSGLTPIRGSLYDDHLKYTKPKSSGFWTPRRIWLLFILAFLSGFGYWYYVASSNNNKNSGKSSPTDIKAVAMTPLKNLTGNESYDYLGFSVANEIISEISNLNIIEKVVPMSSVMPYMEKGYTHPEIAKSLALSHLFTGIMELSGDQLKFSVHLVDTENNHQLWSRVFTFPLQQYSGVFEMQQNIAKDVVALMGLKAPELSKKEQPTKSDKAYNLYMKSLHQAQIKSNTGLKNSNELLKQAIAEDPGFVNAYYQLAANWFVSGTIWSYTNQDLAWRQAQKYLYRVLDLDSLNEKAIRLLKTGEFYYELNVNPKSQKYPQINDYKLEDSYYDYTLKLGLYDKAADVLASSESAISMRPNIEALMALISYFTGDTQKALQLLEDSYWLYTHDHDYLREAAKAYYFLSEYEKMELAVRTYYDTFETRPAIMHWLSALTAKQTGDQYTINKELDWLRAAYHTGDSGSPAWFLALYHAHMDDHEKALDWLERSYAAREVEMTWLAQEPDLAPLGNEPRYQALLDSMNFPESARKHVKNSFLD
ncbi:helix-turn-helix domain-containing protein [Robertkochia marina]|uniref:Helix-turn-helix domain-containing protein n=1 Tax=Robertkochia marina TaxID=1227945 RepID=A0A4S3M0C4_9FLAO|nr:helix-turn-helix domain-containing protein [Robertkochia marina]THD67852.1 helix-turn-helix domain-containing protein [Robertkochia marina]TRZ42109.1 helix-turn-helix domain-containing protein [Robertkochia marina]